MTVEPAASGDSALMWDGSKTINFPYASDIVNAANNTNTGVSGKYVVDMNGKILQAVLNANSDSITHIESLIMINNNFYPQKILLLLLLFATV